MKGDLATYPLDIPLKGGRTYVRGADIYTEIAENLLLSWPTLRGRCKLAFHRMPRRMLEFVAGEVSEIPGSPEGCIADFSFSGLNLLVAGWVLERDIPIASAIAYDEDALMGDISIEGKTIRPSGARVCHPIDLAVVLTKTLHNRIRPPASGKWIFTRLDLHRPLLASDSHAMSISLERELGNRLTRSNIVISGEPIGSIYFSAG